MVVSVSSINGSSGTCPLYLVKIYSHGCPVAPLSSSASTLMGKAGPCTSTGTFTSLSMVTDRLSSRAGSSVLTLSGLLELSKGIRRELSTAFLESPAEPFLGPSGDFLGTLYTGEVDTLSTVHSSSASSTVRDAKLFETGRGETTLATFFWVFVIFFVSNAMRYLNIEETKSEVEVDSL